MKELYGGRHIMKNERYGFKVQKELHGGRHVIKKELLPGNNGMKALKEYG